METRKKRELFILGLIILVGMILRYIRIFWGYPNPLHADEPFVIESAIDILQRHSWESDFYSWPCQLPIKVDSILFQIFSYIRYGVPAYVAFETHVFVFYVVARAFTALLGTLMIPFSYLFLKKAGQELEENFIPLFGAFLVAVFPIFVEHSAYATADIPLSLCCLITAYISLYYLKEGTLKQLVLLAVFGGISVTIKYPGALNCFYLAIIVTIHAVQKKDFRLFWRHGLICLGIALGTVFVIAPNLITNVEEVLYILGVESTDEHLGISYMGYFEKLRFYLSTCFSELGVISYFFFTIGICVLLRKKKTIAIPFGLGGIFYVAICTLGLHWVRWGMPMYITFLLLFCVGAGKIKSIIKQYCVKEGKRKNKWIMCVVGLTTSGMLCYGLIDTSMSTLILEKEVLNAKETRNISAQYCAENGITVDNSIYEGYTPLATSYAPGEKIGCFEVVDGKIEVKEEYSDKQYFVMSTSFASRYRVDDVKMEDQEGLKYRMIDEQFELIYKLSSSVKMEKGIMGKAKRLVAGEEICGNEIRIYKIQ